MKCKLSEYSNVIKCEVKLPNRRVTVLMLKRDGSFQFQFKRLDAKESVVIEENIGRVSTMSFRLSTEATQAMIMGINEIIKYVQSIIKQQ